MQSRQWKKNICKFFWGGQLLWFCQEMIFYKRLFFVQGDVGLVFFMASEQIKLTSKYSVYSCLINLVCLSGRKSNFQRKNRSLDQETMKIGKIKIKLPKRGFESLWGKIKHCHMKILCLTKFIRLFHDEQSFRMFTS